MGHKVFEALKAINFPKILNFPKFPKFPKFPNLPITPNLLGNSGKDQRLGLIFDHSEMGGMMPREITSSRSLQRWW